MSEDRPSRTGPHYAPEEQAPISGGPPPAMRFSLPPVPSEPSFLDYHLTRARHFIEHLGDVVLLSNRAAKSIARRPFEWRATLQQLDSLGVKSMGIVAITSLFIGMVMTVQFGFSLRRFGGVEYI